MTRPIYLAACSVLLFGSGFASLVYQITWIRLLGLSLGSTSVAVSTVLSVFFLGLALGSLLAERLTRGGRQVGFGTYAALELCIGLSALLLLPALLSLDALLALVPALGSELALKFALAALLFFVPTVCMGATFPLMATLLARSALSVGRLLSVLYAVNTLGAVLGALASGFLLIPRFGLDGAIHIGAGVSFAVAVGALMLRGGIGRSKAAPPLATPPAATVAAPSPYRRAAGLTLFVTGFTSIAIQVGWTKYLSIFTGSTLYGLSQIVTVFLAGLALGSGLVSPLIERVRAPAVLLAWGLPALGAALLLAHAGLGLLPQLQVLLNGLPADASRDTALRFIAVAVLCLPPTLIFGALFPVALGVYCADLNGVRARVGEAYAINTLAGIAGSLCAGFVIIPAFGTDVLLQAMSAIVLLLSLVWLPVPALSGWRRPLVAGLVALVFVVNLVPGRLDYPGLIASVGYDARTAGGARPDLLFLREGQSGIVSLVSFDGETATLQNNGLNELQINLHDRTRVLVTETLLGLAPALLHPAPHSAFVLGFGGGITTDLLTLTGLDRIKVVELEPAVVDAVRQIPDGPAEALQDPRVSLAFNDARNTLLVDPASYDLIISQPSHPWLAGSANVFTEQFWRVARGRLNPGGIFSQWVNLFHMDATTLRSIFQAFYGVFEHGFVLANIASGDLVLIGSPDALAFSAERIDHLLGTPPLAERARAVGLTSVNDLLWYFGLSRGQALAMADGQAANSDTNILSEVRLAGLRGRPPAKEDPYRLLAGNRRFDIAPLLGDAAPQVMGAFARALLRAGDTDNADIVIGRLAGLDAAGAAELRHRRLLASDDYGAAFALFDSRTDWSGASRRRQAAALLALGDWPRARAALGPAPDGPEGRSLAAFIALLAEGDAVPAVALLRSSPWEVARLAAGFALPSPVTIAVSRALLAARWGGETVSVDQLARLLVEASDRLAQRLSRVEIQAMSTGDQALASQAGAALARLDPTFE